MRFKGFIGSAYTLRSVNAECQRCVNLYPEVDELGTLKDGEVDFLLGTPGLRLLNTIGSGAFRGQWVATNGVMYAVIGNTLYSIDSSWASTVIGTLVSSTGPVSMSDNSVYLGVVDGDNYYYSALGSTTLTRSTDTNFIGATNILVADQQFVFIFGNTFYVGYPVGSAIAASSVIQPVSGLATNCLQPIKGAVWHQRNLWLICETQTEIWFDSGGSIGGGAVNPFQIVQGGHAQIGGISTFAIAQIANSIIWLGRDRNGSGMVFKNNGYSPQRISTHAVELALQSYGDLSDTTCWAYEEDGHQFVCFNVPGSDTTWVFDDTTGMWHERQSLQNGVFRRHRAQTHAFAYNLNTVGDYQSGKLYALDSDVYADDTTPMVAIRASPHISADMNRVFHHKFQLDFEPGVGLTAGQGANPQVMMQYSDDGGHSWSNELWTGLGPLGTFLARAMWRRLGQSRSRVYRIMISDPVKRVIIGASLDLSGASS